MRGLDRRAREIREEIRFHLEERARELEAQGFSPEEARRRARQTFGDPERVAERTLHEWWGSQTTLGGRMIAELWHDARYALRTLVREPVFAIAAGVSLALAIGGNAAIFGIVDATLLRRPPVRDPEGLVAVYTSCRNGEPRCASSYPDYLDYRAAGGLVDLAATDATAVSAALPGESPSLLDALGVTGNYFGMLGVAPALGRLLQPGDDTPGATSPVVVLSHDTWRSRFGLDPAVVGSTLRLNGVPYEVVGVAPDGFRGMALGGDPDLFLPLTSIELLSESPVAPALWLWEDRGSRWITQLVGRRRPDVSLQGLQDEMDAVSASLNQTYPDLRGGRRVTVDLSAGYSLPTSTSGRDGLTGLVTVLACVVVLNLVLAGANVANLLLARGATRGSEMGVRLALGSSSGRLVRQLLAESATLALFGGVLGLGVALLISRALSAFELPGGVPLAQLGIGIDGRVFAFALVLSLATGIAFGIVPALRAGRRDPSASLGAGMRTSRSEGDRLRKVLVATQVCACLILLAGAGLFLRGLRSGLTYDMGMEPARLAIARFDFSLLRYQPEEAMLRVDEILERARALPGVESAAITTTVPLLPGRNMGFIVEVDGYQPGADEEMRVEMAFATEGFFRSLGAQVVAGRDLELEAAAGSDPVLMVNRRMAEAYWEGRATDGWIRWRDQPMRVVGVTENSAWRFVPQPPLNFITASLRQHPTFAANGSLTLLLRGSQPEALLDPMRSAILNVDPDLTLEFVRTMEDVVGTHLSAQRMGSLLLMLFGGQALVLAFVGIGGVVAYVVSRQKKELGIRMALGASRVNIQSKAVLGMAPPVAVGLAVGLVIATQLGPRVQAFLVEASATDPTTYGAAAALLALVAGVAAWIPARAAARVDPVRVLKAE